MTSTFDPNEETTPTARNTTRINRSLRFPADKLTNSRRNTTLGKKRANKVIHLHEAKNNALQYKRAQAVDIIPRNSAQENYVDALHDPDNRIIFAIGPAGTGKTMLAVLRAIKALRNKEVSRIVVTRPAVSVDEQHGFLPGDLNKKMEPWTRPIFDVMEEYWSPKEIQQMVEERIIEISPLAYMRGRTFKECFIVADEMQNATPDQMKMLLTRVGTNTLMSVTGDLEQHDRGFEKNGLKDFLEKIKQKQGNGIAMCTFNKSHIERDQIVAEVLSIYETV